MASARLVKFAAVLNRGGVTQKEAALRAGYAESTAHSRAADLVEQARAAGLLLTEEEATEPLRIIREAVTAEDWKRIAAKALEQAANGDTSARKWLSEYVMGKPAEKLNAVVDQETRIIVERKDMYLADSE